MTEYPAAMQHGPIEEILGDIFWVKGSVQLARGLRLNRNMTIVRSGDELTVVSAVRLSPEGEAALAQLGTVRHVVKIGHGHGMDDGYYVERFGAAYWTLPGGNRPTDPKPDMELAQGSLPILDTELFEFKDSLEKEGALLVRREGGVLITCDSVQHWANTKGCSPAARVVVKLIGNSRRPAQIAPPWLKIMTPKGTTLQRDFERLGALEFKHLIGAHGDPLRGTAKEAFMATLKATF